MMGQKYQYESRSGFFSYRDSLSPKTFKIIYFWLFAPSSTNPDWKLKSRANTELLGMIFGYDKYEILVVAHDIANS